MKHFTHNFLEGPSAKDRRRLGRIMDNSSSYTPEVAIYLRLRRTPGRQTLNVSQLARDLQIVQPRAMYALDRLGAWRLLTTYLAGEGPRTHRVWRVNEVPWIRNGKPISFHGRGEIRIQGSKELWTEALDDLEESRLTALYTRNQPFRRVYECLREAAFTLFHPGYTVDELSWVAGDMTPAEMQRALTILERDGLIFRRYIRRAIVVYPVPDPQERFPVASEGDFSEPSLLQKLRSSTPNVLTVA